MAEINIFFTSKTKKINKIQKNMQILAKLGKWTSNLMMNIRKLGKMLKSEKIIIIFAKIRTEEQKLS